MAYNMTKNGRKVENLDRHLKLENPLGDARKPVKVGDEVSGLLLGGKDVYIEGDAEIAGDLKIGQEITSDNAVTLDVMGNIDLDSQAGTITIKGQGANIIQITEGRTDLFYDADNNLRTTVSDEGVTEITASGSSDEKADIIVSSGGAIKLNSALGNFVASKDGTEFSAASSAFAGMILGYTAVGVDATAASVTPSTSYAVTDATHKVTFKAPPSGKVEIFVSIFADHGATRGLFLGLSDNATYAPIDFPNANDVTNQHEALLSDETDEQQVNHRWVVTGLTAGTEYTWFLGAKSAQSPHVVLRWGGDATDEYAPFIMKAIALPHTIYDGT